MRPWALLLGACFIACLPRHSRRLGGIMVIVISAVACLYFFIDNVFRSFAPSG